MAEARSLAVTPSSAASGVTARCRMWRRMVQPSEASSRPGASRRKQAAVIGVTSRATRSGRSTATATVGPNWRKCCPAIPDVKPTGAKTATMVKDMAMAVSPISDAASSVVSWAGLPVSMRRTMFPISTTASSIRYPVSRVIPGSDTVTGEKPGI